MNIDRDDENATRYEMTSIDEQIAFIDRRIRAGTDAEFYRGILASLEKLAAIESGTDAPVGFIARGNSSGDVWFEWAQNSTVNTLDKIIPLGKSVPVFLSSAKLEVKSLEKHCSFHGGYGLKKNCIDCNTALEKPVPVEPECPPDGWPINPHVRAWRIYAYALQSALKLAQDERDNEKEVRNCISRAHEAEQKRAEKAEALAEQNRKDAERYRWLVDKVMACDYGDNDKGRVGWIIGHCKGPKWIEGLSIDAAIDSARAE